MFLTFSIANCTESD